MNKLLNKNNRGFTLVELMITLAIASMVMAGIYQVYQSQLKSYVVQNAVRDTQEDLRSAFYYLERTIRMAGFDPNRGARATMPSQLGLLPDLSYFGHGDVRTSFADNDVNESKFKSIVFTLNANGEIRPPGGLTGCGDLISTDCARKIDL
jgi:prepilin-type N-terminal cleavage/methylation domain-containing protein